MYRNTQRLESQIFKCLERVIGTVDNDFVMNMVTVMWRSRTHNGRYASIYRKISSAQTGFDATIELLMVEKEAINDLIRFCYSKQLNVVSRLKKLNKCNK